MPKTNLGSLFWVLPIAQRQAFDVDLRAIKHPSVCIIVTLPDHRFGANGQARQRRARCRERRPGFTYAFKFT